MSSWFIIEHGNEEARSLVPPTVIKFADDAYIEALAGFKAMDEAAKNATRALGDLLGFFEDADENYFLDEEDE